MKRRIVVTPRFNDRRIYLNRNARNDLFYINAGGITYPDKDYYIAEHYPKHYSVQYILSGKGFIEYGGKRHEITAGDMLYLGAADGISYGANPDNPFTKIWINGLGKFWQKTFEIFSFTEPFGIIHADEGVIDYFHRLFDIAPEAEVKREKGMTLITELMNVMYEYKNGGLRHKPENNLDMSREIKRYIDLRIYDDIKLSDIAGQFDVSERTVYSKFLHSYGKTPAEYIKEVKLSYAGELLLHTKYSISEIAEKVGIFGESYFCKVFKIRYGLTPQQYRKQISDSGI